MKKLIQTYPVEILFSSLFLSLAVFLNLQFLEGANINHIIAGHDEYLTVREVYSIINPLSWKHCMLAIISGDILYYGRVMFYTDALFAYIPYKIWGIGGMVYAIRIIHSIWILMGFLILNNLFIKTNWSKFLFLFGSAGVFYSIYFVQMPKPEPLQFLFIALFLRGMIKNNYAFGKYYLWLGLALATKINVLLILPFMFLLPWFIKDSSGIKTKLQSGIKALIWFLVGFLIGIPCLMLTPIRPIYLKAYIHETIFGTSRSYDNPNLTFIEWLESGFGGNYLGSHFLAYVFLFLAVILAIYTLQKYLKAKDKLVLPVFIISSAGLILMLSVMILTKRLWPHYLWTGFVLTWLSFNIFTELNINLNLKKFSLGILSLFFAVSAFAFYGKELPKILGRDKTNEMLITKTESAQLYQYLESNFKDKVIGIDGSVFYPYRHFIHSGPYHPFASEKPRTASTIIKIYSDQPAQIWECEVVVFKDRYPPLLKSTPNTFKPDDVIKLYSIFEIQTMTSFVLQTKIGRYWIYKRINNIK